MRNKKLTDKVGFTTDGDFFARNASNVDLVGSSKIVGPNLNTNNDYKMINDNVKTSAFVKGGAQILLTNYGESK